MKKEVMHNIVVLLVLAVAVGAIFMNSIFNFTGYSVIEGYNETSCIDAGYNWENLTDENCTTITTCINETVSCDPCLEYEIINETTNETGECINWTSCINESCSEEQNCTDIIKYQCVGDICDSDHLDLCDDEASCTDAEGHWYDNTCNSEKQCTPKTCSKLNYECGTIGNGCGETLECGSCDSGYTCKSGTCEKKKSSTSDSNKKTSSSNTRITGAQITNTCTPNWECADWSECINETQTRTCYDSNNCSSEENKPETSQFCQMPETCFDGIKNQNEKGIDCGGICEKRCSVFTIIGSVINGPIESSKEFFEKNKVISLIVLGALVLLSGGVFALKIFLKKSKKSNNKKSKKDEDIGKKIGDITNI